MVTGRKWGFPLDYSTRAHLDLIYQPKLVNSFARHQAIILAASWKIGRILINKHHAFHHKLIHSLRPDPKIFKPGDYVFAYHMVQSSSKHCRMGKLKFAYTEPWVVLRRLKGASYDCKHTLSQKTDKFHAFHLSPVPPELVQFSPLDGPDDCFGQIHCPLHDDAYKPTGLDGFLPYEPFQPFKTVRFADDHIPPTPADNDPSPTHIVDFESWSHHDPSDRSLHFPSLWELGT
jgi:hypothetical protein